MKNEKKASLPIPNFQFLTAASLSVTNHFIVSIFFFESECFGRGVPWDIQRLHSRD